ncbi:MAG: EAL domain-containing protein, partial [Colwellia sp.]
TKLPNRFLLTDRITQAISQAQRTNTYLAICFLDFDGFKPINDTYGHEAGDKLLIEMANRFENILREGDTVARIGGDEFVFLLVGITKIEEYELAIKRILHTIAQPMTFNKDIVTLTGSIGVTIYEGDDKDADILLRHADQAMYEAKQQGKNCYYLFDAKENTHSETVSKKIKRIEQALINHELVLFYQPKVNLRTGKAFGLEALIRWQHPEKGLIPPNDFLPLIEHHELMEKIGRWVIETALQQMTAWLADGIDLEVSVNVSSRQLQQENFVSDLKELLRKYPKINPENLEMEVLETAALENIIDVATIIEQCGEFGVNFALDDFGTGYSSLTYLKRLPAKTLKIDLSFVQKMLVEPSDFAIVQGILGLASAFQSRPIAEGVETLDHALILLQLGCQCVQGYGISKPMPAHDVAQWLKQWQLPEKWQRYQNLYWDDTDFPILLAQIEHRFWVEHIVNAVTQKKPIALLNIANHLQCNFGKWYHSIGIHKYQQFNSFKRVESSHIAAHKTAELIELYIQKGQFK